MKVELATAGAKPDLPAFHVEVRFGAGVPLEAQGPALLAFEKDLRQMGVRAEVFLETRPDDSKLRRAMTPDERKRL